MYADDFLRPWHDSLIESLPPIAPFDAHTHTGSNDPDGFKCSPEELLSGLGEIGARAAVFTMHEPDGYPVANDSVMAEAAASDGVLVPFCRLDPHTGGAAAAAEAERCLDAGARGIKLHPRAEQILGRAAEAVGIVRARVGVGVERVEARQGRDHGVAPGTEEVVGVHERRNVCARGTKGADWRWRTTGLRGSTRPSFIWRTTPRTCTWPRS